MPISQNPKECGWFYHAPARKVKNDKVDYPAPSNIPGIGFDEPGSLDPEEVKEMVFRETDSDYIRMAKMGGRKDLLAFTPDKYRSKKEQKGYARSEWYYLEDNRLEDEEKKAQEEQEWQFLLPEYMVHKAYRPSFEDPNTPPLRSAAPYHEEKDSGALHGKAATDKTVKIPEVRRHGYGVRNERPPLPQQKLPPREKAVRPKESEHFPGPRNRQKSIVTNEKEDPTSMMKLLAGEYEREWYSKLAETQTGAKSGQNSAAVRQGSAGQPASKSAGPQRVEPQNASRRITQQEEEKEMFKMARFKNIPSKVDTHQRPEIMATVK